MSKINLEAIYINCRICKKWTEFQWLTTDIDVFCGLCISCGVVRKVDHGDIHAYCEFCHKLFKRDVLNGGTTPERCYCDKCAKTREKDIAAATNDPCGVCGREFTHLELRFCDYCDDATCPECGPQCNCDVIHRVVDDIEKQLAEGQPGRAA